MRSLHEYSYSNNWQSSSMDVYLYMLKYDVKQPLSITGEKLRAFVKIVTFDWFEH